MVTITVFGGSGFVGRRIVRRLADDEMAVRVAVRHPERARSALRQVGVGRVEIIAADARDPPSVAAAVAGADGVVNAVSAYVQAGDVTFAGVHELGAETIAKEAAAAGVIRLVLISGIGADPQSPSPYIRARGRGEQRVKAAFPRATIVRPSAMFGPGDALFAGVADLARFLPLLPLIGGGGSRLQPTYVEDTAEAVTRILVDPGTAARTYELAGPRVCTLRDSMALALAASGRRRLFVPIPFPLAEVAARLLEATPWPLLTTAQVDLLRHDNVASGDYPGFADLGIIPASVEKVVPTYLAR